MFVPVNGNAEIDLTKILTVANGTAPDSMKFNFNVYEGTATTGTALDAKFGWKFNAGNYTSNGARKRYDGVYTGTFKLDVAKLTEGKPVGKYTFTIVESMDTGIPVCDMLMRGTRDDGYQQGQRNQEVDDSMLTADVCAILYATVKDSDRQ